MKRLLVLILLFLPNLVSAQELHTFSNGEVADANDLNQNFSELLERIEYLESLHPPNIIDIAADFISPYSDLEHYPPHSLDQIADGISDDIPYPHNGFVSLSDNGVISLEFTQIFDISSFLLWNDVNVGSEGINVFSLVFFDVSNNTIRTVDNLQAPVGQVEAQEYPFNEVIEGVKRVELVIHNCLAPYNRIEVREVAFTGSHAS